MEWVSVAERLPVGEMESINGKGMFAVVLVHHAGGYDVAIYYDDSGFSISGLRDDSEEGEALYRLKTDTITHWMPLPEPPK